MLRRALIGLQLCCFVASPAIAITVDPPCSCDCDLDGRITVSDLVRMVNVALANAVVSSCPSFLDPGLPSVELLVTCVGALLDSEECFLSAPRTPTASRTPTSMPSRSPRPGEDGIEPARQLLAAIAMADCEVTTNANGASMHCNAGRGHEGTVTLRMHSSVTDAENAFDGRDEAVAELGGGSFREEQSVPPCCRDGSITHWVWQRECWVAHGNTFDDTHFLMSPRGPDVIQAIVESGRLDDLLTLCPETQSE